MIWYPCGTKKSQLVFILASLLIAVSLSGCTTSNDGSSDGTDGSRNTDGSESNPSPTNSRPTARFTIQCNYLECAFDASESSDHDGSITSYAWDFGDGTMGTGVTANHTYASDEKDWKVELTIEDNLGSTHSTSDFAKVVAPAPDPQEFSGTGDKVTSSFTTNQNLLRITMDHSGSSNFAIWLLDSEGNNEELFVNEIGSYDGSRYFSVPSGEYRMEVTADGSWAVTIEQPRDAGTAPSSESGNGDAAVPGISFERGLVVLEMTYQGDSNFAVWVYDSDGDPVELAANEIGDYEGEEAIQMPSDGVYYIDVTGHGGSWTISFS